jgi:hypothetical protein
MNKVAKGHLFPISFAIFVLASFAGQAYAQGPRKDDIIFSAQVPPMAGATVRICTSSATGQPCSSLASIFSDAELTQALANPLSADGLGNYTFYATPGRYDIEINGPGITTKRLPNGILPSDPSSPKFTIVTTTNGISAFSLALSGDLAVSGSTSAGSILQHHLVDFATGCDGLEDPANTHMVGNASHLAPGSRGRVCGWRQD